MLKIGHRGASGLYPENTLAAFVAALESGADGVELDVQRLKTGELAVMHDDTAERTTDGSGALAQMALAEIRALKVKGGGGVPILPEALSALRGAYCFIEIKHDNAALAAVEQVKQAIKGGYPADRLWLISFRHGALKRALEAFPVLNVGASFERLTHASLEQARALMARAVLPHHESCTLELVEAAHALGLQVIAWTANEPSDIARLKGMGVDGIMSDYPERLLA